METVLLHKSAFLYVTSIFRLSSFVFANALLTGITKTFVPFYSSFPEILRNFVPSKYTATYLCNKRLKHISVTIVSALCKKKSSAIFWAETTHLY